MATPWSLYQWRSNHSVTRPKVIMTLVGFPDGTWFWPVRFSQEGVDETWNVSAHNVMQGDMLAMKSALTPPKMATTGGSLSYPWTSTPGTDPNTYVNGVTLSGTPGMPIVTLTNSEGLVVTGFVRKFLPKMIRGNVGWPDRVYPHASTAPAFYDVSLEIRIPH